MSSRTALLTDSPFRFIAIEGVDGSGKTTVARRLAKAIHAKSFRTPPPGFAATRNYIDVTAQINSRFLFYLCSVAHASESIRGFLQTRHVVCDRYIASTVAYHRSLGLSLTWDFDQLNLVQPHFTFFLQVTDEKERRRRIAARHKTTAADSLLEDPNVRTQLIKEFRKFSMIEVDTCSLTVDEVVSRIREQIRL